MRRRSFGAICIYIYTYIFTLYVTLYQDRLGTNVGETQKADRFLFQVFCGENVPLQEQVREQSFPPSLFLPFLNLTPMRFLPRQARDKHGTPNSVSKRGKSVFKTLFLFAGVWRPRQPQLPRRRVHWSAPVHRRPAGRKKNGWLFLRCHSTSRYAIC